MREKTVSLEEALQAVVAALMFGEDIGLAALARQQGADAGQRSCDTLCPGAGNLVRTTEGAMELLARAQSELPARGIGLTRDGGRTDYDLRGR